MLVTLVLLFILLGTLTALASIAWRRRPMRVDVRAQAMVDAMIADAKAEREKRQMVTGSKPKPPGVG